MIALESLELMLLTYSEDFTSRSSFTVIALESLELIILVSIVSTLNVPDMLTESLICIALESAELMLFNSTVPTFNVSLTITLPAPAVSKYIFSLLLSARIVESTIVNPPR